MEYWRRRAAAFLTAAFLLTAAGTGVSAVSVREPPCVEAVSPEAPEPSDGFWSFSALLRTAFGKAVYAVNRDLASPDGSMTAEQYLEVIQRLCAPRQRDAALLTADGGETADSAEPDAADGAEPDAADGEEPDAALSGAASPLRELGDNPQKRLLLFGDADWGREQVYPSEEEARGHMADVEVPVWILWDGEKRPGTMTLTVHAALAEDVQTLFTEIYNDPEQFPIESMGGFRYRSGTDGEHNNGTAIDLNADQNCQIREGVVLTGSCWEPGVNPYSIPAEGSVVRIFASHGWSWGGDAWAENADSSAGYHDYMHFSYRGR